jgi:class 3 adenylate cyclase
LHRHGGYEVKTEGDAFMVAFPTCQNAVRFCLDAQRTLHSPPLVPGAPGAAGGGRGAGASAASASGWGSTWASPEVRADGDHVDYFGPMVNRSARILPGRGTGGQILASGEVWDAVGRSVDGAKGHAPRGGSSSRASTGAQTIVQLVPEELVDRTFPAVRGRPGLT